jgi:hypothetical protein
VRGLTAAERYELAHWSAGEKVISVPAVHSLVLTGRAQWVTVRGGDVKRTPFGHLALRVCPVVE